MILEAAPHLEFYRTTIELPTPRRPSDDESRTCRE
jgi:hypothetical protein